MGGLDMKKGELDITGTYYDSLVSMEMRRSFEEALKRGIYKELHHKKMLRDEELCLLLKNSGIGSRG